MESDMEKQDGRRRQEKEGNGSDSCSLDVDAEGERCPQKAMKELENMSAEHGDVISQLPDLAQDRIFSLLGVRDKVQGAQVCSSWHDAVYRPCQWKEVKVRVDLCKLPEEALASLKERKIRHLEVDNLNVESNNLDTLRDSLVTLDLKKIPLSLDELQNVFHKSFKSLKKLCVFVESKESLAFQRSQQVFQHFSHLEDLDLLVHGCEEDVAQAVGRCLRNLKHFSLVGRWYTACRLEFLGHLSSLQSLNLEYVTFQLQGIDCLKSSCKSLKNLSMKCCCFIDCDRWPEVLCQLSSFEELKLVHCTPPVADGLRQLAQGQRNLKVLMYDIPLFPSFVLDLGSLAQIPYLEKLSVSCCCLPKDADLRALSCGLKKFKSLAITHSDNFSATFMKVIAGLSSLQELSLREMPDVDGTALDILSNGSCQLRKLELMRCDGTGGEDIEHVAGMSSLRDLTLHGLNLGSAGLNCLKQGTLRLEALSIVSCDWTFWDVKPWLEKQQSLQQLHYWASSLTEAERIEAQNLRKVLPSLKDVVLPLY